MGSFPCLGFLERNGVWLSAALALSFLVIGLYGTMVEAPNTFGAILVVLGAIAVWGLMRLLSEIARLLSETLIPRP